MSPDVWRRVALGALALVVASGLAACGKRADLRPPEEAAAAYTWPEVYPKPETVLPRERRDMGYDSRQRPPSAGDLTTYPDDRRRATYGSPPVR